MAGPLSADGGDSRLDRRLMLWLGGAVLLIILAVSVFAPTEADNDPRPSTDNTAPGGARAALLLLQATGQPVARWDQPLEELSGVDAARTTLVLAEPGFTALDRDRLAAALKVFLERGGRVLTTGSGGLLLPGGSLKGGRRLGGLCVTEPEGAGPLAQAGRVETYDNLRWGDEGPTSFTEQRCGPDAVVVRVPVGPGEAIWWSAAAPLSNAELHNDADLKLLLLSLGQGRRVLFDESLQSPVRTQWSAARGLPLWWMLGQAGVVFALLVFSFSRRRGPVRLPVAVPRSSPLEFAVSMGDLYEKAGATGAATEAARRRLEWRLRTEAGLGQAVVAAGPDAIVRALEVRFGGTWRSVGKHLEEASAGAATDLKAGSALKLVQALAEDGERVRQALRHRTEDAGPSEERTAVEAFAAAGTGTHTT